MGNNGKWSRYIRHCLLQFISNDYINSLAPGRSECHYKNVIFNLVLVTGIFRSSHDNALRWMPQDLTDKSTLVQVMAWCRQATSHYMSQWWPWSMSPYGITRPQWVDLIMLSWHGNVLYHWSFVRRIHQFSYWVAEHVMSWIPSHRKNTWGPVQYEYVTFNTKILHCPCRKSYCGDKTTIRSFWFHRWGIHILVSYYLYIDIIITSSYVGWGHCCRTGDVTWIS